MSFGSLGNVLSFAVLAGFNASVGSTAINFGGKVANQWYCKGSLTPLPHFYSTPQPNKEIFTAFLATATLRFFGGPNKLLDLVILPSFAAVLLSNKVCTFLKKTKKNLDPSSSLIPFVDSLTPLAKMSTAVALTALFGRWV